MKQDCKFIEQCKTVSISEERGGSYTDIGRLRQAELDPGTN